MSTAGDLTLRAERLIAPYVEADVFSGAALVAVDGRTVFSRSYGLANRGKNLPVTPETRFSIASVSKQFTAAAILQLVDQRKLGLDDPMARHYPDAPASWNAVTVRHLLTHSSGIPNFTLVNNMVTTSWHETDREPDELVAVVRDMPLAFTPGGAYAYSNTNYVLLGRIVERLSGQSLADYLQARIFAPLGMRNTGVLQMNIVPEVAQPYVKSNGAWLHPRPMSMTNTFAAGDIYSTTGDLLLWQEGLVSGRVVTEASLREMTTAFAGRQYGLGLFVREIDGHAVWEHGGDLPGVHAQLSYRPDARLTVVVLSNEDSAPVQRMAGQLAALHYGVNPLPEMTLPAEALLPFAGVYRFGARRLVRVKAETGRLTALVDGQATPLSARGPREFFSRISDFEAGFDPAIGVMILKEGGVTSRGARISEEEARRVEEMILSGQRIEVEVSAETLDRLVGNYRLPAGQVYVVSREGTKPFIQPTGGPKLELAAESESEFFFRSTDAQAIFALGPDGRPTALRLRMGGQEMQLTRDR